VTGLDEISVELRTVDNYTRLLQTELKSLNQTLTESRQRALSLLQCHQLPLSLVAECHSVKQEVVDARLFLDYLQVMRPDTHVNNSSIVRLSRALKSIVSL